MAGTQTRLRVWAVGYTQLRHLFQDIVAEFAERADVRVLPLGFEEAAQAIEAAGERVDVVVAAGLNGDYLRRTVPQPVILVKVTASDILQALASARAIDPALALLTHGEVGDDFDRFSEAFRLDFTHARYQTPVQAQEQVDRLKRNGIKVIAGPGMVNDMARRAGLHAVYLYSLSSVRRGFEAALEVGAAARIEKSKRQHIDAVLRHLRDGVVALDAEGRIESLNAKMAAILKCDEARAQGRSLRDWMPGLPMPEPAGRGEEQDSGSGETVYTFDGIRYVVHAAYVLEAGVETGSVYTFQEAQAVQRLQRSLRATQRPAQRLPPMALPDFLGRSAVARDIRRLAAQYARTDASLLLLGETGTGKEILAQGIHHAGARRDQAFLAVNCAALPEALLESELFGYEEGAFTGARRGGKAGLFEAADGGTVFLDEIAEMPLALQSRLLRVLQQREVTRLGSTRALPIDVRVIAATHRDLECERGAGRFREDLYYRLNVLRIQIPPLRERRGDIALLAANAYRKALESRPAPDDTRTAGMPVDLDTKTVRVPLLRLSALRILGRQAWRGNVRELGNIMERLAVHASLEHERGDIDAQRLRELAPELSCTDGGATGASPRDAETSGAGKKDQAAQTLENTHAHRRPEKMLDASETDKAHSLKTHGRASERALAQRVLAECGGDRAAACARLGISRSTLRRRLL